jgi:hypothetical protein
MKTKTASVFPLRGRLAVFWAVPLLLLALSALVSSRSLALRTGQPRAPGESGKERFFLEVSGRPALALGFRNALADLVWLGAVQVSGASRLFREDYDRFSLLVRTVTNFDPKFDVPYLYAGIVLAESPDHAEEALGILKTGEMHLPREWRLPFYAGYIHYFTLGDPIRGGKAIEEAARTPGSPAYLPLLASRMFAEGREPEAALSLLDAMVGNETDPARLEALKRRRLDVVAERDIQTLERAVEDYRARTGAPPGDLSHLVAAGSIPALPEEPRGGRYFITPSGEVRSDRMAGRLKVFVR